MPSSAPRTSCYSEDVRWLIVFKHLMGKTHAKIRRDLSVVDEHGHEWIPGPCGRTIDRILERFKETGDVKTHMGKRAAPPQNAIFGVQNQLTLIEVLLDSPGDMLSEIRDKFAAKTGVRPHISTICRAIKDVGFTLKKARAAPPRQATPRPSPADVARVARAANTLVPRR